MTPDPICASCRGSFVEKMENPADDPREFQQDDFGPPSGIEPLLMAFSNMLENRRAGRRSPTQDSGRPPSGFSFQIRSGSGVRTVTIGGAPTMRPRSPTSGVPTMTEYLRRDDGDGTEGRIAGPLMAQYLMALLGRDPFSELGMGAERGQMGDYVFNQEALDRIITQIMENSNANRPVPATEEIIDNLPREVLETGSPTLEKDCAVCKEQFKTETEDPDEQIVITLPCKHPFHEPCILPWLKSSGTCPVCRHALVPQPEHHPPPGNGGSGGSGSGSGPSNRSPPSSPRPPGSDHDHSNGILHSLFGYLGGGGHSSGGNTGGANSNSTRQSSRRETNGEPHIPGRWDDLD